MGAIVQRRPSRRELPLEALQLMAEAEVPGSMTPPR